MEFNWVYKPPLSTDPTASSRWPTRNKLNGIFKGSLSYNTLYDITFIIFLSSYRSLMYDFWCYVSICVYKCVRLCIFTYFLCFSFPSW